MWTASWWAWAKPFSVLCVSPEQLGLLQCGYLIGISHLLHLQNGTGGTWKERKSELPWEQEFGFFLFVLWNQFLASVGCKETGVWIFSFHILFV